MKYIEKIITVIIMLIGILLVAGEIEQTYASVTIGGTLYYTKEDISWTNVGSGGYITFLGGKYYCINHGTGLTGHLSNSNIITTEATETGTGYAEGSDMEADAVVNALYEEAEDEAEANLDALFQSTYMNVSYQAFTVTAGTGKSGTIKYGSRSET